MSITRVSGRFFSEVAQKCTMVQETEKSRRRYRARKLNRDGDRCLRAGHGAIEGIALDGLAPSLANEADKFLTPHALRRGGSGIVVDLFFNDSAIDIVCAETQGNLGDLRGHHLPVRLDVREIIEHQAADGDLLDVEHAGGLRQVLEWCVIRVES